MTESKPWRLNILPLRVPNRADILKQKFQDSLALPFEQVLPEVVIQTVLKEQGVSYRQTLYTPIVTLWAWMSQVLDSDKSLSNAVNRIIAWLATAGETVPSADTGAYSKARKRLQLVAGFPAWVNLSESPYLPRIPSTQTKMTQVFLF